MCHLGSRGYASAYAQTNFLSSSKELVPDLADLT